MTAQLITGPLNLLVQECQDMFNAVWSPSVSMRDGEGPGDCG